MLTANQWEGGSGKAPADIPLPPAYASIYCYDASAAQSIPTGTAWTKLTAFTTNGLSANCSPDATNDKIMITQLGVYRIAMSGSSSTGTANVLLRTIVRVGGTAQENLASHRELINANKPGAAALSGFINVTSVPVDVDVAVSHDNGGSVNITVVDVNLSIERVA